jgi:sec-independent protein translocase protein TatA
MIPALPQVGGTELLILLVIILLLFGAKRIPQLARSLGTSTREFRKSVSGDYAEEESGESNDSSEGQENLTPEHAPLALQNAKAERKL